MADEAALRARLESNYAAFSGMMSLTPASLYYGQDNDDQWQRTKQTKEQKQAAKRAKLDPDSYKTALDVHQEDERKRKRETEPLAGPEKTQDSADSHDKSEPRQKKAKLEKEKPQLTPEEDEAIRKQKAEKRRQKRVQKQSKKQIIKDAKKARKAKRTERHSIKAAEEAAPTTAEAKATEPLAAKPNKKSDSKAISSRQATSLVLSVPGSMKDPETQDTESVEEASLDDSEADDISLAADTPTFDNLEQPSSASSTSSIVPPSEPQDTKADSNSVKVEKTARQQGVKVPNIDSEVLKERLEARMTELRAARKADGPDGKPARSRQELIEARRYKDEKRKQRKKELKTKARLQQNEAEVEAARLRGGSGSPLWSTPSLNSPKEPQNLSFGKIAFADGAEVKADLASTGVHKKRGPLDAKTALEAAAKQEQRLKSMDEPGRKDIEEKEMWLNAKKRVQGERVRDNTSLLKKTLKRKEKDKLKSEREWNERIEGVAKGKEAKQRKREQNLQKRRDEKGGKKSSKPKTGSKPAGKPQKRPGFEGSWKIGSK